MTRLIMTVHRLPIFSGALLMISLSPGVIATALAQTALPYEVSAQPASPGNDPSKPSEGYVLGAGDVIEVSLVGRSDFQARVQIQVDGTVGLPLVGDLKAANRTVLQFREDVRSALIDGGFYTSAQVAIVVVTFASRYVTVLGEVATPGLVPIDRSYHVSEILARVGGPRPTGADEIIVRRDTGEELTLTIRDLAIGGDASDPVVYPGDKLFIAAAPQYFIYGQVNAAGSYRVERGMSLRMALARGGGLTSLGSESRIKVIRDGVELKKFDPNAAIKGGDVIVVGERFF